MASNSQYTYIADAYLLAILSNCDTIFMDAYLHAIVNNYDKLFRQLHLFNLAQKQLLQAIRDDASETDLRALLDSTLLKITDGANEEQGDFAEFTWHEQVNGKARLGPESPEMLARGRVYEKALAIAIHNTRIEKFLVMELEQDANLTDYLSLNLPEARRLKIACWAATCNFVHMVMALICWNGKGTLKSWSFKILNPVLTIAIEFGYVELFARLILLGDFHSDYGNNKYDFDDLHLRETGKPIQRTFPESGYLYYYAFIDRLTPLNLAAKLGNVEMVNTLLACKRLHSVGGALTPEAYWCLYWGAKMEHVEVVNAVLFTKDVNAGISWDADDLLGENIYPYHFYISTAFSVGSNLRRVSFTPLQIASIYGHASVVKVLCHDLEGCVGAMIENHGGVTALQIATELKRDDIVKILTDIAEVEKDVKRLYRDRQVHVDAASAILVGAALIASVTFAGWLQPPLGYSPFFGSASLEAGAPTPSGMYSSFVSVENHPIMKIFWIFNSLSFFFAIATLMVGATAALPPRKQMYIGVVVRLLRRGLRVAYALLAVSVACVMGAFASAGFLVLPPIQNYTTIMQATVGVGVTMVFLIRASCKDPLQVIFKILTRINHELLKILFKVVTKTKDVVLRVLTRIMDVVNQIYYQYDPTVDITNLNKELSLLALKIHPVTADCNCLYRNFSLSTSYFLP